MANPWEKYQTQPEQKQAEPAKPWEKFAKPAGKQEETEDQFQKRLAKSMEESQALQKQIVDPATRAGLKNLIGNSPTLQAEYLRKKGFKDVEIKGDRVFARDPETGEKGVIDPAGFDLQDVTDVAGDVIQGVAETIGSMFAPVLGAAGAAAGAETGRQVAAQQLGFREDFDPEEVVLQAGMAAAIPAVARGARGLMRAGQKAAGKMATVGKPQAQKTINRLGDTERFRQIGQEAKDLGLTNLFRGKEGALKKVAEATDKLGKSLESQYKKLDDAVITRYKPQEFIETLGKSVSEALDDTAASKPVIRELNRMAAAKKSGLAPTDLWDIAKKLDDKAGTFRRSTDAASGTKADALNTAASTIREQLRTLARSKGMDKIIKDSDKFNKLSILRRGFTEKVASELGGREPAKKVIYDAIGDILHKGQSGVGSLAAPVAKAVPEKAVPLTAPLGTAIGERLRQQGEKKKPAKPTPSSVSGRLRMLDEK